MGLVYRELRPEEFHLAPREVPGSEWFSPENCRIMAAINESGEVVSTWTIYTSIHIEPFWIRQDYRKSKSIMRRMTEAMKARLKELGVTSVYTVVMEKTPVLARFARWFGAEKVDGTLYLWKAPKE